MLITCVILMMIDVVMHRQGQVTWRTTRFLLIKLFYQPLCICSGVVVLVMDVLRFWFTIALSFMVQMLKILTDTYTSRIVRSQSSLKDVIEQYFWNGLNRIRLKAMKALYALHAKYTNVLVEKRTLVEKSKILNLKPNCIYSMQSIEQHYYRET